MKINHLTPNLHLSIISNGSWLSRNKILVYLTIRESSPQRLPSIFFIAVIHICYAPFWVGLPVFPPWIIQLLSPRKAMASIYPPFYLKYYHLVKSSPVTHSIVLVFLNLGYKQYCPFLSHRLAYLVHPSKLLCC